MNGELKVLMMGGQRTGKSSALAAIMDSFVNGPVKSILSAQDVTNLQTFEGEKQVSISRKLKDIHDMLLKNVGKEILVDSGKTDRKWDYRLELSIPESTYTMNILFTDISGEMFDEGNPLRGDLFALVKEYDIFVIAVDTPFMMEAKNPDNKLVNKVINRKFNCVDSIHDILAHIDDNNGKDAKLVIFVPIKCEKWARQNELDKVSVQVEMDYSTAIKSLVKYKNLQLEIMPIQTIGSVFFMRHREAFVYNYKKSYLLFFERNVSAKCAINEDQTLTLYDGSVVPINGKVESDISAILIPNTTIVRPNSWFFVESKDYKPHNCEQLAFHILDFMLSKVVDFRIREDEKKNPVIRKIQIFADSLIDTITWGLWNKLKDIFGNIPIEKMVDIVFCLHSDGLYKDSGEGFKILTKCNFKTYEI